MKFKRILSTILVFSFAVGSANTAFSAEADSKSTETAASEEALSDSAVELESSQQVDLTATYIESVDGIEGGGIYFDAETGEITDADPTITSANIPSEIEDVPVTSIGRIAFQNCTALTTVTIPNSVTYIGLGAFNQCSSLESISIPGSVETIDDYAFRSCTSLKTATLSNGIKNLNIGVFQYCSALETVSLPDTLESIGESCFSNCTALKEISIPAVETISKYAFYYCTSLSKVEIAKGVVYIEYGAFEGCSSLTTIDIPSTVTYIETSAFDFCKGLELVTIYSKNLTTNDKLFNFCGTLTVLCYRDSDTANESLYASSVTVDPSLSDDFTVNVNGCNVVYDGQEHTVTTELQSGATILYRTTEGNYSLTTAPTYKDAGSYTIYYKASYSDYSDKFGSAVVTINPKSVTADLISDISDVVYTGSKIEPDVTVTDGTPSIITENDYDLSYGDNVNVAEGGTVTIEGKGNYTRTATKPFNITKAPLTASAEDLTITYGDDINLNVTYTGFVGPDTKAVIKKQPTDENLGATPSAGTQKIELSGAEADNYSFTYEDGKLTVNKKDVSVTSVSVNTKTYDGTTDGTIDGSSAVFDGVLSGDDVSITASSVVFESAEVGENIPVSITGISLTGSDAGNYNLLNTNFSSKGTITATAPDPDPEPDTDPDPDPDPDPNPDPSTESSSETTTEDETETTTKTSSNSSGGGSGSSYYVKGKVTATTEAAEEDDTEDTTEAKTENTTEAAENNNIRVSIGSSIVVIGDKKYEMDAAPYIQTESNSTLVPLRFVALAILGGDVGDADTSDIISWDAASKTATITVGSDVISFTAGSNNMVINGKAAAMSSGVKAEITDGRLYIPFRALGEALGVEVDWEAASKTAVYITE